MSAERVRLLGVEIDALRADELMHRISGMASDGRSHHVCYVNAECLNQAIFDRRYRAILQEADVVYPDGMGVVWASRLTAHPLPERITLADALPRLCQMAVERKLRLFLLGGSPGVAEQARKWLQQQFPGLAIVGAHDGYFAQDNGREVIDQINQTQPHILLAGMGVPKQRNGCGSIVTNSTYPSCGVWGRCSTIMRGRRLGLRCGYGGLGLNGSSVSSLNRSACGAGICWATRFLSCELVRSC